MHVVIGFPFMYLRSSNPTKTMELLKPKML